MTTATPLFTERDALFLNLPIRYSFSFEKKNFVTKFLKILFVSLVKISLINKCSFSHKFECQKSFAPGDIHLMNDFGCLKEYKGDKLHHLLVNITFPDGVFQCNKGLGEKWSVFSWTSSFQTLLARQAWLICSEMQLFNIKK